MSADRTLKRNNVEKISEKSVTPDEVGRQRAVLETAERKLARLEQGLAKVRDKLAGLRQQLTEARSLHREWETTQTKSAVTTLIKKVDNAVQQRDRVLSDYREMKLMVRDQRTLCRSLEKKEEAKQKAVARFLKEWERRYDQEIRIKEKTVRKRERLGKR
ncbi:MAG: hypothetical protein PVJ15_02265 [Gammaproteobacteria bacterium]